ncbi:MAG: hypothetical protein WD030_08455 [Pirellulales bacterium]
MVRIFLSLSLFALLMTAVTGAIGFALGDLKTEMVALRDAKQALVDVDKQRKTNPHDADLQVARNELASVVASLERVRTLSSVHRLIGVATALIIVFVNSVSVTYFIGTSRWIKEVCDTYPIGKQAILDSRQAKSASFAWSVVGIATALGMSALGAASDPSSGNLHTEQWVDWHLASALGGIVLLALAFYQQWSKIHANQQLIGRVLDDVRQVREERNLPVG